jgi:DNA-binding response OmpR family regulator
VNDEYHVSSTVLMFNTLELICGKKKEKLTLKEAQLLRYFIINKNKILAREDILTEIWGEDDYFLGRSMDVFISRLRKYVLDDKGIDIRTVRGMGFILEEKKNGENH